MRARPITEEIVYKIMEFTLFKYSGPVISEVRILGQRRVISRLPIGFGGFSPVVLMSHLVKALWLIKIGRI